MRISLFETTLNSFGIQHHLQSTKGSESLRTSRSKKETVRGLYINHLLLDSASKLPFKRKKYPQDAQQHKLSEQSFIKNTSTNASKASQYYTPNIPHKQYFSSNIARKEQNQNKDMSYTKILAKLQAKDKIIKQLKKLSETNISNKLKQSYRTEKGSLADCSNQLNTERIQTPKAAKGNLNESLVYISPKHQENYPCDSLKNSYYKDKYYKSKNPQESTYNPKSKLRHKHTISGPQDLLELSYTSNYYQSYSSTLTPKVSSKARNLDKTFAQTYAPNSKLTIHDFIIGKSLGEGKFGTVYQAIHKKSKFLAVLKKISKSSIKSNFMIDQFLLQIKLQSFCDHENIVKLYGFFQDRESVYLILEYMQEGTLFKMLKKNKTVSEGYASKKLKEVGQAIKYLHEKGIVHRDIKPENIVISHGTGKLCDFGWAAICNERRKTYCGTFDYTAPEILEGVEYDLTVDLWCLGILAYELLVGKAPFYHHSRKQTMKKILNVQSSSLDFPSRLSKKAISFMQNLIRKKPEQRMRAQDVLKHPFLAQTQQQ